MKIFTVGPVEMFDSTKRIGGEQLPYFRTREFSELIFDIERKILELLSAPAGSRMALLTASGTGAMEAAVINGLTVKDKVIVIDGGGFGDRFVSLCNIYGIENTPVRLKYDEKLTAEHLAPFAGKGYTALLVNIDETSTGQLYDAEMLGRFCRENGMLYIVDAISSFLSDPFDMAENGADIVIVSSQKTLALAPGLSVIAVSPRMYMLIRSRKIKSMYFDLNQYFDNMGHGQTPFTPAVGTVLQLHNRLSEIIASGGVSASVACIAEKAGLFRKLCRENSIDYLGVPLSNTLTPVVFEVGAEKIYDIMRTEYGITLTPNGGALADSILRVGHIGNITNDDLAMVVRILARLIL